MDVAFLLAAFSYLSIKIFSRELIKPLSAFVRKNYLLDKITDTRRAHLASKVWMYTRNLMDNWTGTEV